MYYVHKESLNKRSEFIRLFQAIIILEDKYATEKRKLRFMCLYLILYYTSFCLIFQKQIYLSQMIANDSSSNSISKSSLSSEKVMYFPSLCTLADIFSSLKQVSPTYLLLDTTHFARMTTSENRKMLPFLIISFLYLIGPRPMRTLLLHGWSQR